MQVSCSHQWSPQILLSIGDPPIMYSQERWLQIEEVWIYPINKLNILNRFGICLADIFTPFLVIVSNGLLMESANFGATFEVWRSICIHGLGTAACLLLQSSPTWEARHPTKATVLQFWRLKQIPIGFFSSFDFLNMYIYIYSLAGDWKGGIWSDIGYLKA